MATRKSSIGAELVIDRRKFKAALDASRTDAQNYARSLEAIKQPRTGALAPNGGGLESGLKSALATGTKVVAAVAVAKAAADTVNKVLAANAWYADLKDKMTAVTGSADAAAAHLGVLMGIAREQAMTREQTDVLVSMSERLQTMGYSASQAADFLRELANMAEHTGDSIEDTAGVVLALDKMGQSGDVSLKKIMALSQEMPGLRNVLKDAFGTDTAEELEALHLTSEQLFDGILKGMKRVETSLPSNVEKGVGGTLADWIGADQNWDAALGADREDQVSLAPRQQSKESAEDRASRLAGIKAAAEKARRDEGQAAAGKVRAEGEAQLSLAEDLLRLERERASWEAKGNEEMARYYEDRIVMLKDAARLAKETGLSEARVEESLMAQQKLSRETEDLRKQAAAVDEAKRKAPGLGCVL